jgi:hypothetical protein
MLEQELGHHKVVVHDSLQQVQVSAQCAHLVQRCL